MSLIHAGCWNSLPTPAILSGTEAVSALTCALLYCCTLYNCFSWISSDYNVSASWQSDAVCPSRLDMNTLTSTVRSTWGLLESGLGPGLPWHGLQPRDTRAHVMCWSGRPTRKSLAVVLLTGQPAAIFSALLVHSFYSLTKPSSFNGPCDESRHGRRKKHGQYGLPGCWPQHSTPLQSNQSHKKFGITLRAAKIPYNSKL